MGLPVIFFASFFFFAKMKSFVRNVAWLPTFFFDLNVVLCITKSLLENFGFPGFPTAPSSSHQTAQLSTAQLSSSSKFLQGAERLSNQLGIEKAGVGKRSCPKFQATYAVEVHRRQLGTFHPSLLQTTAGCPFLFLFYDSQGQI